MTVNAQSGSVKPRVASSERTSPDAAKIELAYQRLKQEIVGGVYSPNEHLIEARLTDALGISRNSLRTVLARLEHEGLIVLEPNRGGRVRDFSVEEAADIARVRGVLEGLVARLAALYATDEQREQLREILALTEQALEGDDLMRYCELNREFHALLEAAAGSATAAGILDSLRFPLVKFSMQAVLVPGRKAEAVQEHHELLRAIDERDPDAAERAARVHIENGANSWPYRDDGAAFGPGIRFAAEVAEA